MMNFFRRALCYILRQRLRSLLLSGILFITLFVCLLCVMLMRTSQEITDLVAMNSNANVIVFDLSHQNGITDDQLETFLEVDNIRAVNRSNQLEVTIAEYINIGATEPVFGVKFPLLGLDDLTAEGPFYLQNKQLTAGHLSLAPNEIIIFSEIAKLNGWEVGCRISFAYGDGEATYGVVAGLYRLGEMSARLDSLSIYVTPDFINNMQGYDSYSSIVLYVANPSIIESTAEKIGGLLNYDSFTWGISDFLYRQMRSQLEHTNKLVSTMLLATIIMSTVIVSLLLSLWTRERRKEAALLLAIGEKKVYILGQRLVEVSGLFFLVFIGLTLLLMIFAPQISEWFYQAQSLEIYEDLIINFQLQLALRDIIITGGSGVVVLFITVLVSLIPIISLMPQAIFSSVE